MLGLLVLVLQAAPADTKCAQYADQVELVLASDRGVALDAARRLRRECRGDFPSLFRAGRALSHASGFERGANRDLRVAARPLLDRAAQLQPRNAGVWLEYGLLLRKQGGIQVDAQRAIRRALELADEFPDSTPRGVLAELNFQRARYYQDELDRMRWLKDAGPIGISTPACVGMGAFCENYTRPEEFNQRLADVPPVVSDFGERRERVLAYFESALDLDSAVAEVFERYGRELALGEEWERLDVVARRAEQAGLFPGMATAARGLAAARLGRIAVADSLYRHALTQLPDSLHRWYQRAPSGLDSVPDFWTRARPLWLLPFNELEVEYRARVTYAMLVYGDREAGVLGPETPVGDALIRYGWPAMVTQVTRDAGKVLASAGYEAAQGYLDCIGAGGACTPAAGGAARDESGGRWLFWTYAADRPSLMFELRAGARVPRYLLESSSAEYARQLRAASPLTFRSQVTPKQFRLPVQVVRFKGTRPGETVVSLYSLVAARQMELPPQDSLRVGLFVFRDTVGFPLAAERTGGYASGEGVGLSYTLALAAGRYAYSLEMLAPSFGAAATVRDSLPIPPWPADALSMSDVLVALRLDPRVEGEPRTWRDLTLEPSRTLEVTPGVRLWAVWEVYGAAATDRGTARYDVAVALEDAEARSIATRLLRGLGLGERGQREARLAWAAERRLAADGRGLEYVQIELPEDAAGEYRLVVTVREGGREVRRERPLRVIRPGSGGDPGS